ncbi:MAG: zinc-dependent metalloprotease family protein [Wenzhouxiangella sp.]|jgi:hypothetical protein|nr:zinc-dependent metalloprotease family protein [Wenzhouxiangella sp.]
MLRLATVCLIAVQIAALIAILALTGDDRPSDRTASVTDSERSPGAQPPLRAWVPVGPSDPTRLSGPGGSGFEQLPPERIQAIRMSDQVAFRGDELSLDLGSAGQHRLRVVGDFRHPNGDISIHARGIGQPDEAASGTGRFEARATLTHGESGSFGRISTADGLFLVHSDATGTWLIDLNDPRVEVDRFDHDVAALPKLPPAAASSTKSAGKRAGSAADSDVSSASGPVRIDVMFVYTPDMLERYPDGLIETRLNHLVAIANQAMVDSLAPITVRLVHHRSIDYQRHRNNSDTLRDLYFALSGESIPGLTELRADRLAYGADIVALTWPHDIETRGSCGLAFFPRRSDAGVWDTSLGVHIDNDGASNWSVCSDAVFTHELGHNLNAEHQRSQSSGDDPDRANYAFISDFRYHTVMGSFGTGHVSRHDRLPVFSNPAIQCGGAPCGSIEPGRGADNTTEIVRLAPIVAGYATATDVAPVERPAPSSPDSDGDGQDDWSDSHPFDPRDGEADPDPPAEFVFEPRQLRDTEGVEDWELLIANAGSDQVLSYDLEGGFRGLRVAPEPVNPGPILTEFTDMVLDDSGRIYLLASEDVRRFDRLSGELVDVWLDSALPEPRELGTSFPRALNFLPGKQLVVLGDERIERFGPTGLRLNIGGRPEPSTEPGHLNDAMDLALRAAGFWALKLYVAEASTNRIIAFNTATGLRQPDLAGSGNPHVRDPRDIVFSPDGHLLLANGSAGNVLRYNVSENRFVDEFVAAGAGGLVMARALAFGPDGDLYVACMETHRVLRFDGETGEYLGDLVASRLDAPTSLAFAPLIDEVHPGHSGHFYSPERSGEGWLIEILDDGDATLGWFTYPAGDDSGEQAWIVGYGAIEGNRIIYDDVLITANGRFADASDDINPGIDVWGRIIVEFFSCDQGRIHFEGPEAFGSGSHFFSRLIRTHGRPCGSIPTPPSAGAPGISGQWYDPDVRSQGWFFEEIRPGEVFAAWFTYDAEGRQAWIVGNGTFADRTAHFDELVITRGTRFGDAFDPAAVERLDWGTMQVQFEDCNAAVLEYVSVDPAYGSGILHPTRLSSIDGLECALP